MLVTAKGVVPCEASSRACASSTHCRVKVPPALAVVSSSSSASSAARTHNVLPCEPDQPDEFSHAVFCPLPLLSASSNGPGGPVALPLRSARQVPLVIVSSVPMTRGYYGKLYLTPASGYVKTRRSDLREMSLCQGNSSAAKLADAVLMLC